MNWNDPEELAAYRKESSRIRRTQYPEKQNALQREHYARNRVEITAKNAAYKAAAVAKKKDIVDAIKHNPCVDCGKNFPSECMDFDHIPGRGEKLFSIAMKVSTNGSIKKILEEIEKCELVCANCHRTRTKNRRQALSQSATSPL